MKTQLLSPVDPDPEHPGNFLRLWLMPAQKLTADALAAKAGIPEATIHGIMDCEVPVTRDIAERLVPTFGHAAETLLRMQVGFDAFQATGNIIEQDKLPVLHVPSGP